MEQNEEALEIATGIARLAVGAAGVDLREGDRVTVVDRDDTRLGEIIAAEAEKLGAHAGDAGIQIKLKSPAIAGPPVGVIPPEEFAGGWPAPDITIPSPTPEWVDRRFGGDELALWKAIHRALRLDRPDPATEWAERHEFLGGVMENIQRLDVKALRFEGAGGETDLRVPLARSSTWNNGRCLTKDGRAFTPNFPCEEIFATPDWRGVEGTAVISRPFDWVTGEAGADKLVVTFNGEGGVEIPQAPPSLVEALGSDLAGVRAGEIALVDGDSATAKAGVEAFWEVILDENAACHIALGSALPMAYTDPDDPGVNRRGRHFDVVIGTPDMRVIAETPGGELVLLNRGRWAGGVLPG